MRWEEIVQPSIFSATAVVCLILSQLKDVLVKLKELVDAWRDFRSACTRRDDGEGLAGHNDRGR